MQIYDCHIHSVFSVDGRDTVDDIVKEAIAKGAKAITITDHTLPQPDIYKPYEHIKLSVQKAKEAACKYKDQILVLSGAERGDAYSADVREPFYDFDLDCILGSVHSDPVIEEYFPNPTITSLKYCTKDTDIEFLKQFVKKYYFKLSDLAYRGDVDVITHLTFPFRYINGRNNIGLDISLFYKEIDEVLDGIIKTDKALEVNTSGKAEKWNDFMPNADILKRYFKKGGKNITIGSDAHKKENIAVGFRDALSMLKEIGFTHGSYYVKRRRHEYKL